MPMIYALLSSWLMVWMPVGGGHRGAVAAATASDPRTLYAGDADRADGVGAQDRVVRGQRAAVSVPRESRVLIVGARSRAQRAGREDQWPAAGVYGARVGDLRHQRNVCAIDRRRSGRGRGAGRPQRVDSRDAIDRTGGVGERYRLPGHSCRPCTARSSRCSTTRGRSTSRSISRCRRKIRGCRRRGFPECRVSSRRRFRCSRWRRIRRRHP